MLIKIPKPKASSNKSQTTPQTPPKSSTKPPTGCPDPASLIPFIDRICVVLSPLEDGDAKNFYASISAATQNIDVFQKFYPKGYSTPGRLAWHVIVSTQESKKKWPALFAELDHKGKKAIKFRVEFSPVDIGPDGVGELHLSLKDVVPGGWNFFIKHGYISMIEISVDVPGIGVEDFHVLPVQGLTSTTYKQNGKLETLNLGKPKSSQTKIYDRGQKRIAKGQDWSGPATTRIERRLRPGSTLRLLELSGLASPYDAIQMVFTTMGCPPKEIEKKKEYLWILFLDSVRVRNLNASLKLLPDEKKATYRKWLAQHSTTWWQPPMIWAHWFGVVEKSGLLSPPT